MNLVEVLDAIVQLRRVEHVVQLSSCGVRLLLGEVCTVLLVVENNEEHVVSSACVVPISTVGNTEWGIRSPGITPGTQNGTSSSKVQIKLYTAEMNS